jgi:hypothetical protein
MQFRITFSCISLHIIDQSFRPSESHSEIKEKRAQKGISLKPCVGCVVQPRARFKGFLRAWPNRIPYAGLYQFFIHSTIKQQTIKITNRQEPNT